MSSPAAGSQNQNDTIERTSIVMYTLLKRLHEVLAEPGDQDEVALGMLMGLGMFLDDAVGPFRTERLMTAAPTIILRTDAHVLPEQMDRFAPVLRAFASHLLRSVEARRGP